MFNFSNILATTFAPMIVESRLLADADKKASDSSSSTKANDNGTGIGMQTL